MATIDFIKSNPVLDEISRSRKEDREERLSDARAALLSGHTEDMTLSRGSRLRQIEATATSAETSADIGKQTAGNQIEQSGVGLEQAKTNLGSSKVEAGVSASTAPIRVAQAGTNLRKANADALNTEQTGFYKSLDLLNAGQTDAAKEVARRFGQEIPDSVVNDAELRSALTAAAKRAQEVYPNRPQDQQAYISGQVKRIQQLREAGQPVGNPIDNYTPPEGAPVPQETAQRDQYRHVGNRPDGTPIYLNQSTGEESLGDNGPMTPKSGAAGGRTSVFQQKQAAWLAVHEGDTQGALDFANGRRQMSVPEMVKSAQSQAAREINGNMQLKFGSPAERTVAINRRSTEIFGQLQNGLGTPAPAAPAAPVAPAAQRPDMMTPGNGTQPQNIQLPPQPPGVPPGSSYSPARQMWKSPDGRVFDRDGQLVQQ